MLKKHKLSLFILKKALQKEKKKNKQKKTPWFSLLCISLHSVDIAQD